MAKYMRSGSLTLQDALNAIEFAEETLFGKEYAANSVRVMELVATSACSAYDCEYVALALRLEVPLVTADRRVLREFPDVAVSLETFARREG